MFDVYCLLYFEITLETHRIYLRLALYRDVAWQHIGLGFDLFVRFLLLNLGGRIYLLGWCTTGACIRYCARGASAEVRVSTGAGSHMLGCFERGTDRVSGLGQETTAGVEVAGRKRCPARHHSVQHHYRNNIGAWGGQKGATVRHTNTKTRFLLLFKPFALVAGVVASSQPCSVPV
jgi:hypothetical protein